MFSLKIYPTSKYFTQMASAVSVTFSISDPPPPKPRVLSEQGALAVTGLPQQYARWSWPGWWWWWWPWSWHLCILQSSLQPQIQSSQVSPVIGDTSGEDWGLTNSFQLADASSLLYHCPYFWFYFCSWFYSHHSSICLTAPRGEHLPQKVWRGLAILPV